MAEYFDVLDENGNLTGVSKPRDEVHANGLWHKAVHIWIVNNKEEIMLQKRSAKVEVNPNLWDISAAGHLSAGDDAIAGCLRELKEELGLDISPNELKLIGTQKISENIRENFINNEFNDVFLLRASIDINKLTLQEDEVSDIKYVSINEFREMVKKNDDTMVIRIEQFEILFKALGREL